MVPQAIIPKSSQALSGMLPSAGEYHNGLVVIQNNKAHRVATVMPANITKVTVLLVRSTVQIPLLILSMTIKCMPII